MLSMLASIRPVSLTLPRKSRGALLLLVLASLGLVGCARAVSTTTVHPDGSWTRTVVFHGSIPDKQSMNMGVAIQDAFALPQGPLWKVTQEKNKDEILYTVTREMKVGQTLENDVVAKAGTKDKTMSGQPVMTNTVRVQQIAPGRYEYRETLHWLGHIPKELAAPDANVVDLLKGALPPHLATPENLRSLAIVFVRAMWRLMFGPGDPLVAHFSEMIMQPDLMKHRMGGRIVEDLGHTLDELPGEKLTPQQRQELLHKLITYLMQSSSDKIKSSQNGGPGKSGPEGSFVALTFQVNLPGKVVETNGETDALTGEVYWAVYPEAAALGDVTMRMVCDTKTQAAAR